MIYLFFYVVGYEILEPTVARESKCLPIPGLEQNPGNYSSLRDLYFIIFGSGFHEFNIDFVCITHCDVLCRDFNTP